MGKFNKLLEDITESLQLYLNFLESLDGNDLNASAKSELINIRNLAIGILNQANKLIAKKNGLR